MRGPTILARTLSRPVARGGSQTAWQYHSRSDFHSKVACWTLLFDLLSNCEPMRSAAARGLLGFGINYEMVGPINKRLDLVLTLNPGPAARAGGADFHGLVQAYGIDLAPDDAAALEALPRLREDRSAQDVSEVVLAMEAKACMTEHVKSLPRLHAEILATGYLARLAAPHCILVSYSLINASTTFRTPSKDGRVNRHTQPDDARRVLRMIQDAVPTVGTSPVFGFDAVGTTVIDCCNDGSPVSVLDHEPAPQKNDRLHYERMVTNICAAFRARFRL